MKFNPILAVLGCLFGFFGAFFAYSFSGLSSDLMTNGSITLVASLLGLLGIYLFYKDYRVAITQYVICGLGVLIGTSLVGSLGFIFYIIAAVVAYVERVPVQNTNVNTMPSQNTHYFGNDANNQMPPVTQSYEDNKKLWIIPVVSLIVIILVGVGGQLSYNNDLNSKAEGIELTNISSDLEVSYGYYSGGVQATLTSKRDIDSVQLKAIWYSADGTQIDETYDSNSFSSIKANQAYRLDFPYFESSDKKPAKAEIRVYDSFDDNVLYSHNVTFN